MYQCVCVCTWRSEDNLQESVLFSYHEGLKDQIGVFMLEALGHVSLPTKPTWQSLIALHNDNDKECIGLECPGVHTGCSLTQEPLPSKYT